MLRAMLLGCSPSDDAHGSRGGATLVAVLAAALLSACGGGSGSPSSPPESTFSRIQTQVFDVSCSAESCHSHVGKAGGLVLEEGYSWDELMDKAPANPVAASHGWMRVARGEPDNSFLLAKITDSLASGEG